jgi:hypothetical protein
MCRARTGRFWNAMTDRRVCDPAFVTSGIRIIGIDCAVRADCVGVAVATLDGGRAILDAVSVGTGKLTLREAMGAEIANGTAFFGLLLSRRIRNRIVTPMPVDPAARTRIIAEAVRGASHRDQEGRG